MLGLHLSALVLEPKFNLQRLQPQPPAQLLPLLIVWMRALLEEILHLLNLMLSMAMVSLLLRPLIGVLIITRKTFQVLSGRSAFKFIVPHLPQLVLRGFMHCSHVQELVMCIKHIWLKHFCLLKLCLFQLNSSLSLKIPPSCVANQSPERIITSRCREIPDLSSVLPYFLIS
uniref:Uncharacterized protein n=1 Tax=Opuntia streptacantha TaxID=393608 RepID=A0A7C8YJR0_OPUST